jgi:beta-glucosidase-like glycosyl hydrolase
MTTLYQAAIKAGAKSIMVSSGEINGTPVHASKRMITDILKNRIGFEGSWLQIGKTLFTYTHVTKWPNK